MGKREIKFKVWDSGESRMSESFAFNAFVISFVNDFIPVEFAEARDERFTFLQFTGLRDINGTDVYEGDIVTGKRESKFDPKADLRSIKGVIRWADDTCGFEFDEGNIVRSFPAHWDAEYEVIGNIYEKEKGKLSNEPVR